MTHIGLSLEDRGDGIYDLHFEAGELVTVTDAHAVGQHVRQRLKTYYGEWFMDRAAGVQWLDLVLGSGYDPALAESVVKGAILDTHGVTAVTSFAVRFDRAKRHMVGHSITVRTIYDEEVAV